MKGQRATYGARSGEGFPLTAGMLVPIFDVKRCSDMP